MSRRGKKEKISDALTIKFIDSAKCQVPELFSHKLKKMETHRERENNA
jgi:hypothetical protein